MSSLLKISILCAFCHFIANVAFQRDFAERSGAKFPTENALLNEAAIAADILFIDTP